MTNDDPLADRARQHLNERRAQRYASTRLWTPDPNLGGTKGERALADFFGGEPDLRNKVGGDHGIDLEVLLKFNFGDWFETDVKWANIPGYLLVDSEKISPRRIYVLASTLAGKTECL